MKRIFQDVDKQRSPEKFSNKQKEKKQKFSLFSYLKEKEKKHTLGKFDDRNICLRITKINKEYMAGTHMIGIRNAVFVVLRRAAELPFLVLPDSPPEGDGSGIVD